MKKVIVLVVFLLVSCQQSPTKIAVGLNAEYPPFEYLDQETFKGFNVELMESVMSNANLEFEWKNMSFDGLIPALQSKRVDVIIGAQTTKDRMNYVEFTDIYYLPKQVMLIHSDNQNVMDINNLQHTKIGVQIGTMQEVLARKIENTEVLVYPSYTGALLDLQNKKIDGIIIGNINAQEYIKQITNISILGEILNTDANTGYAFGAIKGNKELINKLNQSLKEVIKAGEVSKLRKKYLGE